MRDGSLASLALVAVAGVHAGFQLVVTVLVTAALAAPLHGRLDRGRDAGPDRAVLGRLLVVDRVRAGLALACLVASVGAPLSGR